MVDKYLLFFFSNLCVKQFNNIIQLFQHLQIFHMGAPELTDTQKGMVAHHVWLRVAILHQHFSRHRLPEELLYGKMAEVIVAAQQDTYEGVIPARGFERVASSQVVQAITYELWAILHAHRETLEKLQIVNSISDTIRVSETDFSLIADSIMEYAKEKLHQQVDKYPVLLKLLAHSVPTPLF